MTQTPVTISTYQNSKTNCFKATEHPGSSSFFRPFIQPKLSINQPDDVYEQEADAVSDKVMRMEAPPVKKQFFSPPVIQKKCTHCEEEEKQTQRKENGDQIKGSSSETENYLSSLPGGKPLSNSERNFFEQRMGYDFSAVRIHNDRSAHQSAKNINALAYTNGNNIVFNNDQYQPNTIEGKKLLAHELTHVVQQQPSIIQRKPKFSEECEFFNQCQVEEGVAVGKQYVNNIITVLTPVSEGAIISGTVIDKLSHHFKTIAPADVKLLIEKYQLIKNELDGEILYVCYKDNPEDCKAESGAVGAYTTCSANSDVHICNFFNVCGCEERGRMIVHELAHHLGLCVDHAYRNDAVYATMTREKAMANADSYATLASDVYTGSRNCIGLDCLKSKMKIK